MIKTYFQNDSILFNNQFIEFLYSIPYIHDFFSYSSVLFHYLGSSYIFIGIFLYFYLLRDRKLGLYLGICILSTYALNGFLKFFFESPRPASSFTGLFQVSENTFGFPSGHVQVSLVVFGYLAYYHKVRKVTVWIVVFLLFMCFSRIYMGLHFLGDVLGGLFFGIMYLFILLKLELFTWEFFHFFKKNQKLKTLLLILILLCLSPLVLYDDNFIKEKLASYFQIQSGISCLSGLVFGYTVFVINSKKIQIRESSKNGKNFFLFLLITLLFFFSTHKFLRGNQSTLVLISYNFILGFYFSFISPILLSQIDKFVQLRSSIRKQPKC